MDTTTKFAVGRTLRHICAASLLVAVSGWSAAQASTCTKLVATGNPEYAPYLWRDPEQPNTLVGANADLMQWLSKEIDVPIETRYVGSWARVQEQARSGRVDLIAGAFLTVPRMEYMDYFYPVFRTTRTVIWTRKQDRFTYKKWDDLRGQRGLTVINNSFGDAFDRYAKDNLKLDAVPMLEQAYRMLSVGRVDYVIYEEDPGTAFAAMLKYTSFTTSKMAVSNEGLHLTMPHQSPCNTAELRGRIAKALYKLNQGKTMEGLVVANIERWRRTSVLPPPMLTTPAPAPAAPG
ncbi:MAG: transporter substrate-binding domain-containing protein [Rhodoferax sp.]|nr:transporter substrate-binding domain-containing protein [Rhodoferax sp.]